MPQLAKLKLHHCIENLESKLKLLVGLLEHQVVQWGHFFENFHEKMIFPKSIKDQSRMVPGSPGHEKTLFESVGSFWNP